MFTVRNSANSDINSNVFTSEYISRISVLMLLVLFCYFGFIQMAFNRNENQTDHVIFTVFLRSRDHTLTHNGIFKTRKHNKPKTKTIRINFDTTSFEEF